VILPVLRRFRIAPHLSKMASAVPKVSSVEVVDDYIFVCQGAMDREVPANVLFTENDTKAMRSILSNGILSRRVYGELFSLLDTIKRKSVISLRAIIGLFRKDDFCHDFWGIRKLFAEILGESQGTPLTKEEIQAAVDMSICKAFGEDKMPSLYTLLSRTIKRRV